MSIFQRGWWYVVRLLRGYRYDQLFREIETQRPARIMEIGTWNGNNAKKMITTAAKFRGVTEIEYYGFDLFEGMTEALYEKEVSKVPPTLQQVEARLKQTGAKITLYKGNTNTVLPEVIERLPSMDLVFIDGGHSVTTIANDWNALAPQLGPETIVIFDDYWTNRTDAGCKPVVDSINSQRYDVQVLPRVDHFDHPDFGRLDIALARVCRSSSGQG
jgi:predicted O-methyltransferase YrrM